MLATIPEPHSRRRIQQTFQHQGTKQTNPSFSPDITETAPQKERHNLFGMLVMALFCWSPLASVRLFSEFTEVCRDRFGLSGQHSNNSEQVSPTVASSCWFTNKTHLGTYAAKLPTPVQSDRLQGHPAYLARHAAPVHSSIWVASFCLWQNSETQEPQSREQEERSLEKR